MMKVVKTGLTNNSQKKKEKNLSKLKKSQNQNYKLKKKAQKTYKKNMKNKMNQFKF